MPRVAPGQRKRAYRPKTRTGCHTCKIRRVKCDETKPSCHACISTGRKCDGYTPNVEATPVLPLIRSLSLEFPGTQSERQSFYFFQQRTAPQLSAFFADQVWERLILQAALQECSIRHAILALGSLHANFEQGNGLDTQSHTNESADKFSLENYGQAINTLVTSLSQQGRPAIDVCLICCILFACLETMRSSYGSAITHVQSGMKILSEVRYNEKTHCHEHDVLVASKLPYVSIKALEEMFMRLDRQVTQMVSGQEWETHAPKPEKSPIFSTLSSIGASLVTQWHITSYSNTEMENFPSKKLPAALNNTRPWQKKSRSILARWSSAYDVYLNIRGDNLTNEKRKGTAGLRILKELGSVAMMLTQPVVDDETSWDVFCPVFRNVVSLAEDIIELDLETAVERSPFCINMALVGPLFQIACRCRDPVIRRRAIALLRNCGRIEGIWNASSASQVAQRVLDIEEAGLKNVQSCVDVPGWARISHVSPVFDLVERKATLSYSRRINKHDLTRQTIVEVIEW